MRYNQKNEKIKWKKPVVKTYGDAVEIIKDHLLGGKHIGSADGYFLGDDPIGT